MVTAKRRGKRRKSPRLEEQRILQCAVKTLSRKEKVKASVYFQGLNNRWADHSLTQSICDDHKTGRMRPAEMFLSEWFVCWWEGKWLGENRPHGLRMSHCISDPGGVSTRGEESVGKRRRFTGRLYTEVSDCSLMTNLWLFGSMNSSPSRRKGSGVTVTTREKSRRRREKTKPWRRAEVTGSSLTRVHWRPLPFCCWYCMVGPAVR